MLVKGAVKQSPKNSDDVFHLGDFLRQIQIKERNGFSLFESTPFSAPRDWYGTQEIRTTSSQRKQNATICFLFSLKEKYFKMNDATTRIITRNITHF